MKVDLVQRNDIWGSSRKRIGYPRESRPDARRFPIVRRTESAANVEDCGLQGSRFARAQRSECTDFCCSPGGSGQRRQIEPGELLLTALEGRCSEPARTHARLGSGEKEQRATAPEKESCHGQMTRWGKLPRVVGPCQYVTRQRSICGALVQRVQSSRTVSGSSFSSSRRGGNDRARMLPMRWTAVSSPAAGRPARIAATRSSTSFCHSSVATRS